MDAKRMDDLNPSEQVEWAKALIKGLNPILAQLRGELSTQSATSDVRKEIVEKLAKEFIVATNTASPTAMVMVMALADKAYTAGLERAAQIVEEFTHFGNGPEAQIKRYIAGKIHRE